MGTAVINQQNKEKLIQFITNFLQKKQQELPNINNWNNDVCKKLSDFTTRGKVIRGSLVLFIYKAYIGKLTNDAFCVAAAIELLHSSLLIHDDIMDNDKLRRGFPTIFAAYENLAQKKKFTSPLHFGQSFGICVGDIGFFMAMELLAEIENPNIAKQLMQLVTTELQSVGLAQMQDVYNGYSNNELTEQEIEQVYRFKTSRYTFSLPMMAGALLAKQDKKIIESLSKIGEDIGLLFQIKDDELSIFGNEKVTGKTLGSDIRENKKTLYRLYLYQKANVKQKKELDKLFGDEKLTQQQLQFIQQLLNKLGVKKIIAKKLQNLQSKILKTLTTLNLPNNPKNNLLEFVQYLLERKN